MLHLPDITLVVLAGNYFAITQAAIYDTLRRFSFDDILLFADAPMDVPVTTIVTPFRSLVDETRVMRREVHPRLKTSHAMMIEWDGYPLNPAFWDDGFRQFDYIGAVWPWFTEHTVGNCGFSLQSRKLLAAAYDDPAISTTEPSDITLCRDSRPYLEARHGIKFADEATADRFATEHGAAGLRTFGFHGLWNMLYFLDDEAMKARLLILAPNQWKMQQIDTLGVRALVAGRRELYRWVNAKRAEVLNG